MSLPIYLQCNPKSASLTDVEAFLKPDLNLRQPIVIDLKPFTIDQQHEIIGLIENYFVSHNISYKFPYPIYILTDHESTITQMPVVQNESSLPKFFSHPDSRMNVKETHLIGKNRLLQTQVKNADSLSSANGIAKYCLYHRQIAALEEERLFYRGLLDKLTKTKKHG